MYPVLFKFGPFAIHAYGFFIALAFLAGILVSLYYAKREGIGSQTIFDLAIYVIISGLVGARLSYVFGQWEYFRGNPAEIFMAQKGGLVFLGGFLLALLVTVVYVKINNIPRLKLFDALAPGVALGYAIARIGCFLNGCCFGLPAGQAGLPAKFSWGLIFPSGSLAGAYFPGQALHPTQLYSMTLMFLAFLALVFLYRAKKFDGQIFFWWLILYSAYRFLIEFLRFSPIHWLGLTPSQWLVILTFALGLWGLTFYKKRPGA